MSSLRAKVSRILTWSCVDGPGNRLVIFLQGCNFNCLACHNPHTIGRCDDCGLCIPACPTSALSLAKGHIRFDPDACTKCDACLDACPIKANPMAGAYSTEQMLEIIRSHKAFIAGVTISGGEPTLQLPFIVELFDSMAKDPTVAHLTRFVDTNGHLGPKAWQTLLSAADGIMLDIKAFNPERHQRLTGMSNDRVLAGARRAHDAGKLHELRFLMIPGETDIEEELECLAAFVSTLKGPQRLRLNAFRPHGVVGMAADWPAIERSTVEQAAERLHAAGIADVVTPNVYA